MMQMLGLISCCTGPFYKNTQNGHLPPPPFRSGYKLPYMATNTVSKLRTFVTFKSNYETETNLKLNICKAERSHFRCAVLPLKIETGRFLGLSVEDRLCQVCDQNAVENEIHFLLHCTLYEDLRRAMIFKSERRDTMYSVY